MKHWLLKLKVTHVAQWCHYDILFDWRHKINLNTIDRKPISLNWDTTFHNLLQYVCVLRDYQISIMYVYKHEGWVVVAGQYCYINYIIIYSYLIRYTPSGKSFLTRMSKGKKRVYLQHGIFLTITLRVRKLLTVGVY